MIQEICSLCKRVIGATIDCDVCYKYRAIGPSVTICNSKYPFKDNEVSHKELKEFFMTLPKDLEDTSCKLLIQKYRIYKR